MLVGGYSEQVREAIWVGRVKISYEPLCTTGFMTASGIVPRSAIQTWLWVQCDPIPARILLLFYVVWQWYDSTSLIQGARMKCKTWLMAPKGIDHRFPLSCIFGHMVWPSSVLLTVWPSSAQGPPNKGYTWSQPSYISVHLHHGRLSNQC